MPRSALVTQLFLIAYEGLSQLISVSELFMTERSGPAQQGEARL
jgi:hypothetical protein